MGECLCSPAAWLPGLRPPVDIPEGIAPVVLSAEPGGGVYAVCRVDTDVRP